MHTVAVFQPVKTVVHIATHKLLQRYTSLSILCVFCLRHCFIETIKYACSAAFSAVKLNDFWHSLILES